MLGRRNLKILFYFQILDPVCHQLFEFYRSEERELQRFSLELVPSLVWLYLSFISRGQKSVSTLFSVQSLYNALFGVYRGQKYFNIALVLQDK